MRHLTTMALAAILAAGLPAFAGLDNCAEMTSVVPFDTSGNCASQPSIPRVLGGHPLEWRGDSYFVANMGNEINIYSAADEAQPVAIAQSRFNVPNQGDSDYDLMAFSVCDDCRFGAAWYKMGTVIFDLGTGARPRFTDHNVIMGANATFGGVAWERGGSARLITASIPHECGSTSAVWRVEDVDTLVPVGCLVADRPVLAAGGIVHDGYMYVSDASTRAFLFHANSNAPAFVAQLPWRAGWGKARGFDIEGERLAQASNAGSALWDISDQARPVKLADLPGSFSRVSLTDNRVFLSLDGLDSSEALFDLDNPARPKLIDDTFWNAGKSWNNPGHACSSVQYGHLEGDHVYLLRYSRFQVANVADCQPGPELIFRDAFEAGNTSAWE